MFLSLIRMLKIFLLPKLLKAVYFKSLFLIFHPETPLIPVFLSTNKNFFLAICSQNYQIFLIEDAIFLTFFSKIDYFCY